MLTAWRSVSLVVVVALAACSQKKDDAATSPASGSTAAPAPSTPTEPAPAKQPDGALDEKAAAIKAALAEDAIVSDPRGQWAVAASASSTYANDKAPTASGSYTPLAATGAPNVEHPGDNSNAWAPETTDKGIEWLEVTFAKPVHATQLRVRQNAGAGAIIKLELIDEGGTKHQVWSGIDDQSHDAYAIVWFDKILEKTPYKTTGARITLATNSVPGWNEIDAVQLLGD